jgi:hypothetical protein
MHFLKRPLVYIVVLVVLTMPVFLVRVFPAHAPAIRTFITLSLFPVICVALLTEALRPLIEKIKGLPSTTFTTDRTRTVKYSLLRLFLFAAGVATFIIIVIPMWRGAYNFYLLGQPPQTVSGKIDSQGSGLTVPFFNTSIRLKGQLDEYIWLYGMFLQPDASYTLRLLPQSNVVLDVVPINEMPPASASSTPK